MQISFLRRRTMRSLIAAVWFAGTCATQAYAAGTVGTGTAASCTEAAFDTALAGGGAITFNCGGAATITLTTPKNINASTSIDGGAVVGGGKGLITLDANNAVRHFAVFGAATLNLSNLSLINGSASDGGAINVQATTTVTLTDVTLEGNNATSGPGGAIFTGGGTTINLTRVFAIDNHSALGAGGVIFAQGASVLILKQFVADHNWAATGGGAIEHRGSALTIADSLFNTNKMTTDYASGGAIDINANTTTNLDISNSTFFSNGRDSSNPGGAIWLSGVVSGKINNSTFAGNYGANTIEIYNSTTTMSNTIVSTTVSAPNCASADNTSSLGDGGNNLQFGGSVPNSCGASIATAYPGLGILADNGGFSKTIALLTDSPAIDAGNDATCAATDQRGIARPIGAHCDIGAFETGAAPAAVAPTITNGPPPGGTVGVAYSFIYTVTGSAPISFAVTTGALPPGLSLTSAGAIVGTPTTPGTYTGTVTASNGTQPDASQPFSITISPSTPPPSAVTVSAPSLGAWGMLATITLLIALALQRTRTEHDR